MNHAHTLNAGTPSLVSREMPALGASSLSDECERTGVDEVVATWAGDANDAAMQSATSVHNARRDGCCDGSWLNIVAVAGADTNAGIRRACEHRSECAFCGTCGATSRPAQGVSEARGGRGHQLPGLQYDCDNNLRQRARGSQIATRGAVRAGRDGYTPP